MASPLTLLMPIIPGTSLTELAATPPDTPVYTWADPPVAGFYHRRMAHELAIHRPILGFSTHPSRLPPSLTSTP